MSIFLRKLLPRSSWTLVAIIGNERDVASFRADEQGRDLADRFLEKHSGNEVKVLAGRSRFPLFRRPRIPDDIADVLAVGIRLPLAQKAALDRLQRQPAICFRRHGELIAAWRFEQPVPVPIASKAEEFLARHFRGERLNFFIPVGRMMPYDTFIDPKRVEDAVEEKEIERNSGLDATANPKHKHFVIEPLIAAGCVTQIAGEPGMGKTQIAIDLVARVTNGESLPGEAKPSISCAVICEKEDDPEQDTIPRLIAAKARREYVRLEDHFDLAVEKGVNQLRAAIERFESRVHVPCRLVVISPFLSFFGGRSNQEAHIRQSLVHIEKLARETGIAILGVGHLSENGDVAGPKTFKRASRASWNVVIDKTDPEPNEKKKRRLLVAGKVNNTDDAFRLGYRIKGDVIHGGIKTSHIEWERIEDAPRTRTPDASEQAKHFIDLQRGEWTTTDIINAIMLATGAKKSTAYNVLNKHPRVRKSKVSNDASVPQKVIIR